MGTHPIFESDFDCLTEQKNMNRSQPPNIIAAQQKLLEGISRQSAAAQNSPEHMKLQQQLKLLGQQVQAAAAASKSAAERLKRGLQHARQLVRESQSEAE